MTACFKAGVIAVPVFPPDPRKLKKDLRHFISTQVSSGATVALTNDDYNFIKKVADIKRMMTLEESWPEIAWKSVDSAIKAARQVGS
jgi:acyl-CoA synthetase (AMP-forming)/AMP-acid ligase II